MKIELLRTTNYLDWLKTKLYLDSKAKNSPNPNIRLVKRGQVYQCSFGIGVGSEQEKNNRPCVILQNFNGNRNSPNTIVAPISHSSSKLPVIVPLIPQLNPDKTLLLDGSALLGNITTISKARLGNHITDLSSKDMRKIDEALAISVELLGYYTKEKDKYEKKIKYIEELKVKRNKAEDELKEILDLLEVETLNKAKEKILSFKK